MHIKEVHLQSNTLDALYTFYADTLGLPVQRSDDEDAIEITIGESLLRFTEGGAHRYHLAFNIPENQFDAGKAWIKARQPLIPLPDGNDIIHFRAWVAHSLYFYDSAGNVLEFIARHRLHNATDEPFSPSSILSISEIGFGVPDVPDAVYEINAAFDLPIFDGADSADFTAIGNDDGLFIVVKVEREWFPNTGVPANNIPLTVVIDHPHQDSVLTLPDTFCTIIGRMG